MTFEEIYKKYGMEGTGKSRWDMDEEEESRFVDECFDAYEGTGFSDTFRSIYEETKDFNGKPFHVLSRCEEGPMYDLAVLPMWNIEFEGGKVIAAFPEEICKTEINKTTAQSGRTYYLYERKALEGLKK